MIDLAYFALMAGFFGLCALLVDAGQRRKSSWTSSSASSDWPSSSISSGRSSRPKNSSFKASS